MDYFRQANIEYLSRAVIEDDYSDLLQLDDLYGDGKTSMEDTFLDIAKKYMVGTEVLEVGCGSGVLMKSLLVTHAVEPHPGRLAETRKQLPDAKQGFIEAIPFEDGRFDTVIAHGVWTLIRSDSEAYIEVNRVLKVGGRFIFDFATETNMPIVKTYDPDNVVLRAGPYGFKGLCILNVKSDTLHKQAIVVIEKVRNFNWKYLRIPQVKGTILNYLEERDWYMK